LFLGEAAFLVLFGFPALLLNPHRPVLFFVLLKQIFGFMALTLSIVGLLTRQGMAKASLGLWDNCIAFALLHVSCAVAVRILG